MSTLSRAGLGEPFTGVEEWGHVTIKPKTRAVGRGGGQGVDAPPPPPRPLFVGVCGCVFTQH